jgi:hypothetical protein
MGVGVGFSGEGINGKGPYMGVRLLLLSSTRLIGVLV